MTPRVVFSVLGIGLCLFLALFVWPTLYTTEDVNLGSFGTQVVRTHRFTGETEFYGNGRWQPITIADGKITFPSGSEVMVR